MSVEGEIFERGKAHAGLSSLVGDKIYPYAVPQGVDFPVVTYQRIDRQRPARASGTDHNLHMDLFQFDGWSFDRLEATNIADEIENAYNRWSADGSAAGTVVQEAFLQGARLIPEDQQDRRVFHASVDIEIWHEG